MGQFHACSQEAIPCCATRRDLSLEYKGHTPVRYAHAQDHDLVDLDNEPMSPKTNQLARISQRMNENSDAISGLAKSQEVAELKQQVDTLVKALQAAGAPTPAIANSQALATADSQGGAPRTTVANWQAPATADSKAPDPTASTGTASSGTGRFYRKPAEQKLQRSAGASRTEPRALDWGHADPKKWTYSETEYNGAFSMIEEAVTEEMTSPIASGVALVKGNPAEYEGIFYQSNMTSWPADQQKYTMLKRTGSGFSVQEEKGGGFTFVTGKYQILASGVNVKKDDYTDSILCLSGGKKLGKPIEPGRGKGCADVPGLKIIGDVDPSDVSQGAVGDCWLLSAISAMAEFDGCIHKIYHKTPNVQNMPMDGSNTYTISLYNFDEKGSQPKDIVVDERLITDESNEVFAAKPSIDGELWVCYIEKAVAIHCGGWDKIDGGTCVHAWRLLTGCMESYTITNDDGDGFSCFGTKNPNTGEWEILGNSPQDGFQGLWPMEWPAIGGGGAMDKKCSTEEMFERLCAFDDNNFLMGCGSKSGSDKEATDGIVDGHAYTIINAINDAGGTPIDMIQVRNPWGKGEFTAGKWTDDGVGWDQHPEVKAACNPTTADDGIFWLEKDEFFKYFQTIYVCCKDMGEFIQ